MALPAREGMASTTLPALFACLLRWLLVWPRLARDDKLIREQGDLVEQLRVRGIEPVRHTASPAKIISVTEASVCCQRPLRNKRE